MENNLRKLSVVLLASSLLAGCNAVNRLSEMGDAPKTSPISNPTQDPNYKPVSMPMPAPMPTVANANSLWRPGSRAFFKDQRANQIGDILTVSVSIADTAELNTTTTGTRDNSETFSIPALLGYETKLNRIFPNSVATSPAVDLSSDHNVKGDGDISRGETINIKMAAVITQILPNGNLVISGKQEVRVNYEMRELSVAGVIRPEDISSTNTITSEKIAEARIVYGGRGVISDKQQPRYGQQLLDILLPF